ncbi:MAG: hypothetical protein II863_06360 [Kiritimatiellae bacterium]|nr:hypothetical protein [Kiritimatiellia bacterium]
MKTIQCILLAGAISLPAVSEATRRYVLPAEGLPSSGSISVAWKGTDTTTYPLYTSVADAVRSAAVSDSIILAPGTHNVTETIDVNRRMSIVNGSWDNTYTAVPREDVVLCGNGSVPIMTVNAQAVLIRDLTFTNGYTNNVDGAACIMAMQSAAHSLNVTNCVFRGNNSAGACICSDNNNYWKIQDCVFSNNLQTASSGIGQGVAIKLTRTGVQSNEAAFGLINKCVFKDNTASAPQVRGGVVSANYGSVRIEGCSFVSNTVSQTGTSAMNGGALYVGPSTKINGCTFIGAIPANSEYNVYGSVLDIYTGADGCVVSNCTFTAIEEKTSTKAIYGTIHVGGNAAKFLNCNFTENTLYANSLLFVENKGDALIRNCLFAGNDRKKNTARLIYRHGTTVSTPTGITVENCTFADNTDTIAPIYFSNASYANYLVNSVFTTDAILSGATESSVLASNCCFTALQEVGGLSFNDKCITVAKGSHKFADAANGDYRLQGRSPLRDKGVTLDWMTDGSIDLDGNPRVFGDSPDIGCYECVARYPGFTLFVR